MNRAPSSSPTVPTRNGPTRWASRPPAAPNTTSGTANRVMPRLAIHSLVSRSSSTTAHRASNAPIIRNTAPPISTAPANGRMLQQVEGEALLRWLRRLGHTGVAHDEGHGEDRPAAMTRNGAGMPNGPTSRADRAGPAAKPATSAASRRPTLWPMRSGSATITMRRIAGTAMPIPMPITKRPASNGTNAVAAASSSRPVTLRAIAAVDEAGGRAPVGEAGR